MTKQMQVMCNVNLYKGDVKAGKWYDAANFGDGWFEFLDDSGEWFYALEEGCAHLEGHPGAYWTLREKPNTTAPIEEVNMSNTKQIPYTVSTSAITLVIGGEVIVVPSSSGSFEKIKEELKKPVHDIDTLVTLSDKTKAVEAYAKGKVTIRDGVVLYEGEAIHNTLTDKLLALMDEGFQVDGWVKFLENLMENPSYRSRNCLYNFLDKFQAPFTEDGCFIAFKRVRQDFKDIHSGKFDNSVGAVVIMDRTQVDDDPNTTCSSGLHVAADSYLDSFADAYNSKTVMVKVNPRDVVAVPSDYNFAKMRVCRYEVIAEVAPESIKARATQTYYEDEDEVDEDYQYI